MPTGQALACERAFLAALDGSCRTPIAGHAVIEAELLSFRRADHLARRHAVAHRRAAGPAQDAARIGAEAAGTVRAKAGEKFFDGWA